MQRVAVIACRRFGTNYQSHLHGLRHADLWREGSKDTKETQQGGNLIIDTHDHEKNWKEKSLERIEKTRK